MGWKRILKKQFDKEDLFNNAVEHLEEFYENKLRVLFNGAFDEDPYVIYVSDQIAEEIYKDKTLLDKLSLHLLDGDYTNEKTFKKDVLTFFEEHLTQKKYVDLAKEHAEFYSKNLYGV